MEEPRQYYQVRSRSGVLRSMLKADSYLIVDLARAAALVKGRVPMIIVEATSNMNRIKSWEHRILCHVRRISAQGAGIVLYPGTSQ